MRCKMFLRMAIFALILSLCAGAALAEGCSLCGGERDTEDAVCTDCFVKLLTGEMTPSPLNITGAQKNVDGTVTIAWEDAGDGAPYRVLYELLDAAPVPFGWTDCAMTRQTAHTFARLVPGVHYVFTVVDIKGNQARYTYFADPVAEDRSIGMHFFADTLWRTKENYAFYEPLTLADFASDKAVSFELYVVPRYSELRAPRAYQMQLGLTAPNGYRDIIFSGSITLGAGRTHLPDWNEVPMNDFFTCLEKYYGGIPAGEYVVTMYLNGAEAYERSFIISE